jgi:microcystin-dependent protein
MPSTFSTSLRLELIGDGEQSGVWGQTTNNNFGELVEQAITGRTTLNVTSGDIILTSLNGVVDQARSAVLAVTGTPGVTRVITIPNVNKTYTVINQTTNIVQVKTLSGVAFNCPALSQSYITCDGLNVIVGRSITDGANAITSLAAPFASPAFTGVPTAPTAALGTNTTQLATTAFTTAAVAAGIPVGLISMWSGSIASIPAGWALCNGASGTPDLRDRFIVGAGSAYVPGATGGADTVTLNTTQIPSHTHTGTTNATDLSHTHTGSGTTSANNVGHTHTGSGTSSAVSNDHTHSGTTGNNNVGHTHTGSGTSSAVSNDHTHSGTTGINSVGHTHGVSGNTGGTSANHVHSYSGTTSTIGNHAHNYSNGLEAAFGDGNILDTIETNLRTATLSTGAAGAHSHTYSGNTDGQNVDHTHFFSVTSGGISTNHNHNFTTGGQSANHTHTYSFTTSTQSADHVHGFSTGGQSANHTHTYSFTTSAQSADHNHTYSFTTSGASIGMSHTHGFTSNATGGGLAHENRPPYFALAYIMKV